MFFKLTPREKKIRANRVDLATPYERAWLDRWHKCRGNWWQRIVVTERRDDGKFYCVTVECKTKRILGCEAGCMFLSLEKVIADVKAYDARKRYATKQDIKRHIGAYI